MFPVFSDKMGIPLEEPPRKRSRLSLKSVRKEKKSISATLEDVDLPPSISGCMDSKSVMPPQTRLS